LFLIKATASMADLDIYGIEFVR